MVTWTKETAIAELERLIGEINSLQAERRLSAPHSRWATQTLVFLEEVFGQNSPYYQSFLNLPWCETGAMIVSIFAPEQEADFKHQEAYRRQLESARGFLQAAKDQLRRSDIQAIYRGQNTGPEVSSILKIINMAEYRLRKLFRHAPDCEKTVQDRFEDLLNAAGIEHSREKNSIEYSSKKYIPDFTNEKLNLAIEIKFCDSQRREKEIIAEINDDVLAYSTRYANLFFVVYDISSIRDVELFSRSFEQRENVIVRVIKH